MAKAYTPDEVELGLIALAKNGGHRRKAAEELKAAGHPIPAETLRGWKDRKHADRYAKIREEVLPLIYARAADEFQEIVHQGNQAILDLVKKIHAGKDDLSTVEASNVARNLGVNTGIAFQRASEADQRPSAPPQQVDISVTLHALRSKGIDPSKFLEGTATEVKEEVA